MKRETRTSAGRAGEGGFSFTEVVLSLGLVASALVTLAAMVPIGQKAAREARLRTVVGHLFEDVRERLEGFPLKDGPVSEEAMYFDNDGGHIPEDAPPERLERRYFRVEVRLDPPAYPLSLASEAGGMKAVRIEIAWPVDPRTGEAVGKPGPDTRAAQSYFVGTLTGKGWKEADADFVPAIGY